MPSPNARATNRIATGSRLAERSPALSRRALVAGISAIVILDWLTKLAIARSMSHGSSEAVVAGFFNIVHVRNTGIAFSLFADSAPWFREFVLPGFALVAVTILAVMLRRLQDLSGSSGVALALVLAGAIGNLSERLLHGYVTDFLDFYVGTYHWPAFNVADSAITVGAAVLILDSLLGRHMAVRLRSAT